jgi:hypothetical protein
MGGVSALASAVASRFHMRGILRLTSLAVLECFRGVEPALRVPSMCFSR